MATNQHVKDFLDYYCAFPDPGYAVLLSGPWGSGKTWFIKKYMDADPKTAPHFLYVSLYGVQSAKDIEAQLYALLHPVLASKGVRYAKNLLTGFVQATIKVDLNHDGNEDASVAAKLPSADLLQSLSVSRNRILVVDDLERCSMPVADVLGFINQFVEHGGVHAVVLANLDEVDNRNPDYRRINEKLIGRTLGIEPDIDAALVQFLSDMPSHASREIAKKNVELIKQVYRASETKNLRLVRHGLVEFDRICAPIDAVALNSEPLMANFLGIFLAHFIEVKSGALPVAQIPNFRDGITSYIRFREAKAEHPDKKFFDLRSKYSALNLHDDTVGAEIWTEFFTTGAIAAADLNAGLHNSRYLQSESQPNWVKLWHGTGLADEEFDEVLDKVDKEWGTHTYDSAGVVAHVAGSLIRYSKAGIYKKSVTDIVNEGKAHIDRLLKAGKIEIALPNQRPSIFARDSFQGLGFMSMEEPSFKDFLKYLNDRVEEEGVARRPGQAEELLGLLKSDPTAFLRRLMLNNEVDNYFYRTPILHHLDVDSVVEILGDIPPESRRTFAYAIKGRYEMHQFNADLVTELKWLRTLKSRLQDEVVRRRGKISSTTFEVLVDPYVSEAIRRLEEHVPKAPAAKTVAPKPARKSAPRTASSSSEAPANEKKNQSRSRAASRAPRRSPAERSGKR